jgi:DNA-binding NtrC family response regulator
MSKMKVLVVDDEKNARIALQETLKEDYVVSTAENGMKAIEKIKYDEPDLVLLDIGMPGMDGFETMNLIRQYNDEIPVVCITGFVDIDMALRALKSGAIDYLIKPFDPEVLCNAVKENLEMSGKYDDLAQIELFLKDIVKRFAMKKIGLRAAIKEYKKEYKSKIAMYLNIAEKKLLENGEIKNGY